MSSTKKSSNRRKAAAVALAVVGVAGLTMAAASNLTLNSTAKFQAGSTTISADCQGTTAIPVAFGDPTLGATTGKYTTSAVKFSGIVTACDGLKYKAAIKVGGGNWQDVTPATRATISGATLDVTLASSVAADDVTGVALTIYS